MAKKDLPLRLRCSFSEGAKAQSHKVSLKQDATLNYTIAIDNLKLSNLCVLSRFIGRDDYSKKHIVLHAINQFAKLFQGYFSVTGETIIERELCDLRVSVVSSYKT